MRLFFKAYILVDCLKQLLNQIIILQQTLWGLKDMLVIAKTRLIVNCKAGVELGGQNPHFHIWRFWYTFFLYDIWSWWSIFFSIELFLWLQGFFVQL